MPRPPTSRAREKRRGGIVEPIEQPLGHVAQKVTDAVDGAGGAIPMQAHGLAVKHDVGVAHAAMCPSGGVASMVRLHYRAATVMITR